MVAGDATRPGACVGRFVVRDQIGEGGMGVVVAAYDPVLDRQIALKLLRAGDTAAGDARLLREAQAMARLSHPNVVAVHEAGAASGRVYLVMELVEGGTLRSWLAAAPRTWRDIRDRFLEAGRGLAAAHAAGLVHRDFKPDNVLIGQTGHAKVMDFGLVGTASAPDGEPREPTATATAGTPRYMAPEQHRGARADARADQFAFCVALYEALWRADPFAAPDPVARRARVLAGDVDPPPPGKLPPRLIAAVLRGLAADPAARFATMSELLDELAVRDPAVARRRWIRLAGVGVTAAGLAAALATALTAGRASDGARARGEPARREIAPAPDPLRFQLGVRVGPTTTERAPGEAELANLDAIAALGATATALELPWSAVEPEPGLRDWRATDRWVAELERRGLEPFVTTISTPRWLGVDPAAGCPGPERNPPPDTADGKAAFADFYRALASRYCGRVKHYAFWSEANGCGWMSCGCGDQSPRQQRLYARWLTDWYQAMRDGCADLVLAVGGLDCRWGDDPDRPSDGCGAALDRLYADGAADAFDAVALHVDGYADRATDLATDRAPAAPHALHWAAIREVTAALARHGNADRPLWLTAWRTTAATDARREAQLGEVLTGLRALPQIHAAIYAPPLDGEGAIPSRLSAAFRDRALGPGARGHALGNPGMEFEGDPPSAQFTAPIPGWGPDGAWALHARFARAGHAVLGRKFGYYSAGAAERFGQTLRDRFEPDRRYCFRSAGQGGYDKAGVLPFQLGYLDATGGFAALATALAAVDAQWRELPGVCYATRAAGPELGRPIAVRFGAGPEGGASDIWFDNLRVVSTPR